MEGIFVYLIQSFDGSYYTGITKDVDKRLEEHNSGKSKIIISHRPYHLVYYKKYCNYIQARKHEKWLKKKSRQFKSKLSLGKSFSAVLLLRRWSQACPALRGSNPAPPKRGGVNTAHYYKQVFDLLFCL
ncbi:MAG: GIY-YIG nuclease family protein [Candidatus Falkowbacteria bacterium]|nr:GIY-YIG nuclease family protein [Candidatus Falkowbacteria bacterium]